MHLLVTRPTEDSRPLACQLEEHGHRVTVEPMLTIEPVPFELPAPPFTAIILTSRHGARALARDRRLGELLDIPVYCVGPATAQAAREAGFREIVTGDGEAASLSARIAATVPRGAGDLVHVRGRHSRFGLDEVLGDAGLSIREVVAYRAMSRDRLSAGSSARLAAGEIDGVLLFSPLTARTFSELVADAGLAPALAGRAAYCLSAAVAGEVTIPAMQVRLAARPGLEEMMELVCASDPASR